MKIRSIFLLFSLLTILSLRAGTNLIGSRKLGTNEHRDVVKLQWEYPGGGLSTCTGTLIESNIILTAAHCVAGIDPESCEVVPNDLKTAVITVTLGSEFGVTRKEVIRGANALGYNKSFFSSASYSEKSGKCENSVTSQYDIGYIIIKDIASLLSRENISLKKLEFNKVSLHKRKRRNMIESFFNINFEQPEKLEYTVIGFGFSSFSTADDKSVKASPSYKKPEEFLLNKQIGKIRLKSTNSYYLSEALFYPVVNSESITTISTGNYSQVLPGDSGGPFITPQKKIAGVTSAYSKRFVFTNTSPSVSLINETFLGYNLYSMFTPLYEVSNQEVIKEARERAKNF